MAMLTLDPAYRRVSVREFLAMELGGARAELDDGMIFMMAGSTEPHARVAVSLLVQLRLILRGTGCRPYNSVLGLQTGERSVRFPDVSVYCREMRPEDDSLQLIGDPQVVFEVLSPNSAMLDQTIKLHEYRDLDGVQEIVFVDPVQERIRLVRRTAIRGWVDDWLPAGSDLELASLGIAVPHAEIFVLD